MATSHHRSSIVVKPVTHTQVPDSRSHRLELARYPYRCTNPIALTVSSSGQSLRVANQTSNNVSTYTINANTGALTPAAGSPFAAGTVPGAILVDPSGKFAYVVNNGSDNISAYTLVASTGVLTPVPGSPFVAGTTPNEIAMTRIIQ